MNLFNRPREDPPARGIWPDLGEYMLGGPMPPLLVARLEPIEATIAHIADTNRARVRATWGAALDKDQP